MFVTVILPLLFLSNVLTQAVSNGTAEAPSDASPSKGQDEAEGHLPIGHGLLQIRNASAADVIIMTRSTLLGTMSQWLEALMSVMCNGKSGPAEDFFSCLNKNTSIPQLWTAMGLNSTSLQVQTVKTTEILGQNATINANSLLTLLSSNVSDLRDLMQQITGKIPDFCLSIDPLMSCLGPYLQACLEPDVHGDPVAHLHMENASMVLTNDSMPLIQNLSLSDSGSNFTNGSSNDLADTNPDFVVGNESLGENGFVVGENVSENVIMGNRDRRTNLTSMGRELDPDTLKMAVSDDDSLKSRLWFIQKFPMMTSAKSSVRFIREAYESLCRNQSADLITAASHVPCMFEGLTAPGCDNETVAYERAASSQRDVCIAATDLQMCYIAVVHQSCNSTALDNILTDLSLEYLNDTVCQGQPTPSNMDSTVAAVN